MLRVKLSKCLSCFYNHLSPQEHLTFRDKPIIRITAKFQHKVLLLRTLAVINTISLRHGLEVVLIGRVRCTSPQRFWSRKATVDVSTFLRPHLRNWCWKPFSEHGDLLLLSLSSSSSSLLLLLLLLFLMITLIIGLLVLRPSISSLLQSATAYFITKCAGLLLQSATILLQGATGESATIITNCDRTPFFRLVAVMKFKFSTHKIYLWEHLIGFVCQHWWLKANITFSISVLCPRKIQLLNFLSYEFTPSLQWVT